MSFLKIKDPVKRDQIVKECIATKKRIRDSQLAERTGDIVLQQDLSKFFRPITETQKAATKEITEGLKPIKERIEQLPKELPQQLPQQLPQPSFSPPEDFEKEVIIPLGLEKDADRTFGIYEDDKGKRYIGNKQFNYNSDKNLFIIGDEKYKATDGLWELITSNKPKSNVYNAEDYSDYVEILYQTSALHRGNNPANPYPKANKGDKWKFVKPIWERTTKTVDIRTGKKIGEGITIIPSDPNTLLERLDLLMASKKAGNTGLRNELVSICDELKRQGVLQSKRYKNLMSIL